MIDNIQQKASIFYNSNPQAIILKNHKYISYASIFQLNSDKLTKHPYKNIKRVQKIVIANISSSNIELTKIQQLAKHIKKIQKMVKSIFYIIPNPNFKVLFQSTIFQNVRNVTIFFQNQMTNALTSNKVKLVNQILGQSKNLEEISCDFSVAPLSKRLRPLKSVAQINLSIPYQSLGSISENFESLFPIQKPKIALNCIFNGDFQKTRISKDVLENINSISYLNRSGFFSIPLISDKSQLPQIEALSQTDVLPGQKLDVSSLKNIKNYDKLQTLDLKLPWRNQIIQFFEELELPSQLNNFQLSARLIDIKIIPEIHSNMKFFQSLKSLQKLSSFKLELMPRSPTQKNAQLYKIFLQFLNCIQKESLKELSLMLLTDVDAQIEAIDNFPMVIAISSFPNLQHLDLNVTYLQDKIFSFPNSIDKLNLKSLAYNCKLARNFFTKIINRDTIENFGISFNNSFEKADTIKVFKNIIRMKNLRLLKVSMSEKLLEKQDLIYYIPTICNSLIHLIEAKFKFEYYINQKTINQIQSEIQWNPSLKQLDIQSSNCEIQKQIDHKLVSKFYYIDQDLEEVVLDIEDDQN